MLNLYLPNYDSNLLNLLRTSPAIRINRVVLHLDKPDLPVYTTLDTKRIGPYESNKQLSWILLKLVPELVTLDWNQSEA